MELDELLVKLSIWTWDFLDDAERAGFSPREDTVTEHLLVEMVRQAPAQVRVHKTTGAEESDSGADFAWAIEVVPSLWLDLLVQAKKLDHRTTRYEEFRKAGAFQQAQHLIAHSKPGSLPLFLFYNGRGLGDNGDQLQFGACTRSRLCRERKGPPWRGGASSVAGSQGYTPAGCTVAAAPDIAEMIESGNAGTYARVLGRAAPWECLLCPFGAGGGRPSVIPWPDWIPKRGLIEDPIDTMWLRPRPPEWAMMLFEGGDPATMSDAPPARYFVAMRAYN